MNSPLGWAYLDVTLVRNLWFLFSLALDLLLSNFLFSGCYHVLCVKIGKLHKDGKWRRGKVLVRISAEMCQFIIFFFLGKFMTSNGHSKINWPLLDTDCSVHTKVKIRKIRSRSIYVTYIWLKFLIMVITNQLWSNG